MAFLDWHHHTVGPRLPCRICRRGALMRDEHGRACHKTCAETEADTTPTGQEQSDTLALVIALPIAAPVIDISTRRRIA